MTPTLRACLFAACIAASIHAHAQKSHGSGPPAPLCGALQPAWTLAQKDEHAALVDWMRAREKQKDGENMQASGSQLQRSGNSRLHSDPNSQQAKGWIREGEAKERAGKQKEKEGKSAEATAEKKLQDAWRREQSEGSRSVQPGSLCGPKR
jgi:hypothetical protein